MIKAPWGQGSNSAKQKKDKPLNQICNCLHVLQEHIKVLPAGRGSNHLTSPYHRTAQLKWFLSCSQSSQSPWVLCDCSCQTEPTLKISFGGALSAADWRHSSWCLSILSQWRHTVWFILSHQHHAAARWLKRCYGPAVLRNHIINHFVFRVAFISSYFSFYEWPHLSHGCHICHTGVSQVSYPMNSLCCLVVLSTSESCFKGLFFRHAVLELLLSHWGGGDVAEEALSDSEQLREVPSGEGRWRWRELAVLHRLKQPKIPSLENSLSTSSHAFSVNHPVRVFQIM